MSFSGSIQVTAEVNGLQVGGSVSLTASGQIGQDITLPAGNAGTVGTRTDNDTATLTLSVGHGLQDGDTVDVFWSTGSRYGMLVSSSGPTSVVVGAVGVGAGDNFPLVNTAIVVTKQVVIDTDFSGDLVKLIACRCDQRCSVNFLQSSSSVWREDLAAIEPAFWFYGSSYTNPLAGDSVTSIVASNGSVTAATLRLVVLYSSN